jgi:hypothetical protein
MLMQPKHRYAVVAIVNSRGDSTGRPRAPEEHQWDEHAVQVQDAENAPIEADLGGSTGLDFSVRDVHRVRRRPGAEASPDTQPGRLSF